MTTVARYNACPVRAELCAAARSEAELIEAPASAIKAYIAQLSGAKWRGIEFKMTFTEWWNWWQVDGRWDNRGSGPENFVMARHGDIGPYAIGNIYCATKRENSSARWPAEIREIIAYDPVAFGLRVKAMIGEGLGYREAADAAGVDKATLCKIANGGTASMETILRVRKWLTGRSLRID